MEKNILMPIIQELNWDNAFSSDASSRAVNLLETGHVLFFKELPFLLFPEENKFLSPLYASRQAKNISYNPHTDKLQCGACSTSDYLALKNMLQRFLRQAENVVKQVLAPYASTLQIGRTSFRPVEISGRIPRSYRQDDSRLHVDAFPATPTQGKRILRLFTNINPHQQDRLWRVGEDFHRVVQQFLPNVRRWHPGWARLLKMLRITKSYRTPYDHIMLHIHDQMKADLTYQKNAEQCEVRFPAQSSWIVQTDHVSHAAIAGQHVLEQTFYLSVDSMVNPELSPLRVLEKNWETCLT